ncbi:MAG: substrate-binding domain-containing protein [Alphaproteobacteria bacterium]|nr:substrate-binding domain-containing protein [Alphaproteobacteria bacterium]MEE1569164.1 substrate-binding domain-containing protein [Alphaproteobacteria bacterium]
MAANPFITVASTTSTQNSGLFGRILPLFTEATGVAVRVIAVGTGQAIRLARRGDADVLFVHDPRAEQAFVADGFGVDRREVMYNDFVVVGPAGDPAAISGMDDAAAALARIAAARAIFVSRGDDSGTNRAERRIWKAAGLDPSTFDPWYRETGSGMGASLSMASAVGAYTLSDRGTWLSFKNRGDLEILVAGDPRLFNQYGVTLVNPARFPHVKKTPALVFMDWLTSRAGQQAIAGHRIGGQQLFFPNAGPNDGRTGEFHTREDF